MTTAGVKSLVYKLDTTITLANLSADLSSSPPANTGSTSVNSSKSWDLRDNTSLTFNLSRRDARVDYWTNPRGTVNSQSETAVLRRGDGSNVTISGTGTKTINISGWTDNQKNGVRLRGTLTWDISTVTNSAFYGGWATSGTPKAT